MAVLTLLASGCGFQPRDDLEPIDAPSVDAIDAIAPIDAEMLPASCKAIHMTDPSKPSGTYQIDPDGSGSDPPISVTCDMMVAGGGWTMVFLAAGDISGVPVAYLPITTRLLTDAQDALIAYRDAASVAVTSHATFALPDDWRMDTPFDYDGSDVTTDVSVDDALSTPELLRYGSESFSDMCGDAWLPIDPPFGRVCIVGTTAPFFSGFSAPLQDACSDSSEAWNAVACAPGGLHFSIAVR